MTRRDSSASSCGHNENRNKQKGRDKFAATHLYVPADHAQFITVGTDGDRLFERISFPKRPRKLLISTREK